MLRQLDCHVNSYIFHGLAVAHARNSRNLVQFLRLRDSASRRIPEGIAACSRWLSEVCETTGNRREQSNPGRDSSATDAQTLEPLPGFGVEVSFSGGVAEIAPPPATSGNPSGIQS